MNFTNPEKKKFSISSFFEDPRKIKKIKDFYFSGLSTESQFR